MKNKRFLAFLIAIIMIPANAIWAAAANYTIVFDNNFPQPQGIVNYGSPLPTYPVINSKWNQPRNTGTNPHNGVDLRASNGTNILAPYGGWVIHITPSSSRPYDIEFLVDANGDRVQNDGDYRIRFYHNNSRKSEGYYTKGAIIGTSGNQGGVDPHLHFGNYRSSGAKWGKNEPNYKHLASTVWNAGMHLDSYNRVTWSSNKASINAYVMDVGGTKSYYSEVRMYYRQAGSTSWIDGGAITRSGDVYSYNFTGKIPAGKDVHWMFRLTRSGVTQRAFVPAKFYQPDANPNATSYAYSYWVNRVT